MNQSSGPFYCQVSGCTISAGRQIDIKRHVTEVHGHRLFCCHDGCDFGTKRKSRLRKHIEKRHNGLLVIPTSFQSMDMAAGDATMETASTQGPAPNPGSFNTTTTIPVYNTQASFPPQDRMSTTQWPTNDLQQENTTPTGQPLWLSVPQNSVGNERDWEGVSSIGDLQQSGGVGVAEDATVAGVGTTTLPLNEVRRGGSAQNSGLKFAGTEGSANGKMNKGARGY